MQFGPDMFTDYTKYVKKQFCIKLHNSRLLYVVNTGVQKLIIHMERDTSSENKAI